MSADTDKPSDCVHGVDWGGGDGSWTAVVRKVGDVKRGETSWELVCLQSICALCGNVVRVDDVRLGLPSKDVAVISSAPMKKLHMQAGHQ